MPFAIAPPIEPMLAKVAEELPAADGLLYEPKWDGFRAIVFRGGPEVLIQSRDLRPLVPTFLGAHEVPDEYRDDRAGYVSLVIEEMLPRVAAEGLAEFCDVFCEGRVFGVGESREVLLAARAGLRPARARRPALALGRRAPRRRTRRHDGRPPRTRRHGGA